jgi:hypothetical protein
LLAATPILHQNTQEKKGELFGIFRQRANPNPYNPNSESMFWKTNSKKSVKLTAGSSPSFLGKRGGKEDTRTNVVWPLPPPRAEKLRVGLSVRRLLPVTEKNPDHLRGVP